MFGQLPSQVLANGTMFDIQVANTLAEWENRMISGNNAGEKKLTPQMSQEEMMAMLKAVKQ